MDVYLVNFVAWTGPMQLPVYIAPLAIINTSMAVRVACLAYLELTLFIQIPLIAICAHLVNFVAWTGPMQLLVYIAPLAITKNFMAVRVACLAYLELTLFIQIALIAICVHLVNLVAWTEPMQLNVPFALLVTSSNTMGVLRVTIVLQGDIPSP
jgi:predicted DNA-binding ribbon-helix-helix protein